MTLSAAPSAPSGVSSDDLFLSLTQLQPKSTCTRAVKAALTSTVPQICMFTHRHFRSSHMLRFDSPAGTQNLRTMVTRKGKASENYRSHLVMKSPKKEKYTSTQKFTQECFQLTMGFYNPRTWEAEAGGPQSQPRIHDYILKRKKKGKEKTMFLATLFKTQSGSNANVHQLTSTVWLAINWDCSTDKWSNQ